MKYLYLLLVFIPVSLLAEHYEMNGSMTFIFACLAIVPLAVLITDATEQIAISTNPKVGGLLNATMANIPELFIGLFAVKAGLYNLMLASMAGSVIGNLMFVLGMSIFCGGLRHAAQSFDRTNVRTNLSLLCFAALSVIMPLAFKLTHADSGKLEQSLTAISFTMASILLLIYLAGQVVTIRAQSAIAEPDQDDAGVEVSKWSLRFAVGVLLAVTGLVAVESDLLVSKVEIAVNELHLPETFIGIIIIPILGNVAENTSAILMAYRNKLDISLEIAVGSSMQISMFVAPALVLLSFALNRPLIFVYDPFKAVALISAIFLALNVLQNGKTYWLEGALLVCAYLVFCVAFFNS